MSFSPVMEWSAKWDWENLVMLGSRVCESPKKFQPTDWGIEEEGEIDTGSFNLSGGSGCGIGGCGSDVGHGSSAKSTISASTDSSSKEGMRTSNYGFEGFSVEFSKREYAMKLSGLSPPLETSVGSGEPLIGLELGSHFENSSAGANSKTSSFIVIPASSATAAKKIKPSCQSLPTPRCIVEGCNLDLSGAKEYHKKHRICESHSKSPKVVIAGHERRFCQQCSRFHGLSEFDEKKRSCRRRLADHNARRRKPPQETMHISPTRLASSFYDGEQRISFVWSNPPLIQAKPGINSMWASASNSKCTLTNGYELKHEKAKSCNGLRHLPDIQLPHTIRMPDNHSGRLLPFKGTSFESLNQGSKETMLSFKTDAAPDLPRALSLLSTSSWGSHEQRSSELDRPFPINQSSITQHAMRGVSQALPLSSSGFWHSKQQSADGNNSSHFQELQLFNAPFESSFYSHPLN